MALNEFSKLTYTIIKASKNYIYETKSNPMQKLEHHTWNGYQYRQMMNGGVSAVTQPHHLV